MEQFDAETILLNLLKRRKCFFLEAHPKEGNPYIVAVHGIDRGAPVYESLEKATEVAREYLADRSEDDLEIRIRGLSSSPQARISNREPSYTAVPTGFVDEVDYVVSNYCVPHQVMEEYQSLIEQSKDFGDGPHQRGEQLLSDLSTEFRGELKTIQLQFPHYKSFAVQFDDPTIVYMAGSKDKLDVLIPHLKDSTFILPLIRP